MPATGSVAGAPAPTGDRRRAHLATARLYLVCDAAPGGRELSHVLAAAAAGGVDVVQLRDKALDDDRLLAAALVAREVCDRVGLLLIVNDRPLVALAARADGVHVGQDDEPVPAVRERVGPDMLIGLSTHSPEQVDAAARAAADHGLDYIGVGPVHATPTKPGRQPVGLELVGYAAQHTRLAFFAIGGVDARNIASVLAAGATRVAVVRAIAAARDPQLAARELRERLDAIPPGGSGRGDGDGHARPGGDGHARR